MTNPDVSNLSIISTVFFALAILHTFMASRFVRLSHRFPADSIRRSLFHFMGEVEVVFGLWAALFIGFMAFSEAPKIAIEYVEKLKFTEPLFVFVVMVICATRPILSVARNVMKGLSSLIGQIFKINPSIADVFVLLAVGPLLGSFITEPAAMTVVALLLRSMIGHAKLSTLYFLLATLFVNISVGGALTPFAAPPILMVAQTWGWDLSYTMNQFGLRSVVICLINSLIFVVAFRQDIQSGFTPLKEFKIQQEESKILQFVHLLFLFLVVVTNHFPNMFMGIFLFFLGVTAATKRYQDPLRMRESLLVAFFLGGLIVFGEFQKWWLQPLLAQLSEASLFMGATLLTAVTDNAALTYLGSQVQGLSSLSQYALVAGALAGGGLTVLANAPNPAGYSILVSKFPQGTVNHMRLVVAALIPTVVAVILLGPWW